MSKHPQFANPPDAKEIAQEKAVFELDNLDAQAKQAKALNAQVWDTINRYQSGKISRTPERQGNTVKDPKIEDSLLLRAGLMTHNEFCNKHFTKKDTK